MKKLVGIILIVCIVLSLSACMSKEAQGVDTEIKELLKKDNKTAEEIVEVMDHYNKLSEDDKNSIKSYQDLVDVVSAFAAEKDAEIKNLYNTSDPESSKVHALEEAVDALDELFTARMENVYLLKAMLLEADIREETKEITAESGDSLRDLQNRLDSMGEKEKAAVRNTDQLENAFIEWEPLYCDTIFEEIKSYKNTETDQILSMTQENAELLRKYDKLDECLIWYGRWESHNQVVAKLKPKLKDPSSFRLESGRVLEPTYDEKAETYTAVVSFTYTATNSFGGRVQGSCTGYTEFVINVDTVTVRFTSVHAV